MDTKQEVCGSREDRRQAKRSKVSAGELSDDWAILLSHFAMAGAHRVEDILAVGRGLYPELSNEVDAVVAQLKRLPAREEIPQAHFGDLFLATACAQQIPAALQILQRLYLSQVPRYVAHIDASSEFGREVSQQLATKLLVGDSPRIAEYSGKGQLAAWLKVAAVRLALDLRRGRHAEVRDPDLALAGVDELNPELALLKARYRPEMEEALRKACVALSARQANLLRMHFAEGMTLEQIARAYNISRATATRWIAKAREELLETLFRYLQESLRISRPEFESLVPVVLSQLHLSLAGLREA